MSQDSEAQATEAAEGMQAADEALDASITSAVDTLAGDSPETKESTTEAPEADGTEPSPEDTPEPDAEAQPRTADGRYASPEEQSARTEFVDGKPVDEAPPEAGEVAPVEEPPTEAETVPEPEDFVFRADGRDFEIPGSTVSEKGLHIPPDQIETVTQLLRYGKTHQGSFRDLLAGKDAEVAQAKVEVAAAQAARTTLLEKLASFGDNPEAMEAFLTEFKTELPVLLANARTAEAEELRKADKVRLAELEHDAALVQVTPQLEDRLEEAIKHYGGLKNLDVDGMRTIWTKLREPTQFGTIFTRGTDGWSEDMAIVEREVEYLATALGGRGAVEVTPERKEAATNAAALKPESKKAPPVAPTKKGPAPAATPQPPKFKTAEEADEWFERGGFHDYFG